MDIQIREIICFGLVGCVAVVVHYSTYYILLSFFSHNIAYIVGYFISFLINYRLTTSLTFRKKETIKNALGFTLCHVVNFSLQVASLNVIIFMGVDKVYAPLLVLALCVPLNFLLVRFVMMRF